MGTDFFAYSRRKIEKDKEEGHFEAAHNREMALRCFVNFLGKEELSLNELTPELMVKFEEWLNTKGRKQSTTRLYLYQISSVYNIAVKEGIVPKLKLLKGVRVALPAKKERELLSVDELRRMRYADLSDSIPQTFARDMFFFLHLRQRHQFYTFSISENNKSLLLNCRVKNFRANESRAKFV